MFYLIPATFIRSLLTIVIISSLVEGKKDRGINGSLDASVNAAKYKKPMRSLEFCVRIKMSSVLCVKCSPCYGLVSQR